MRTYVYFCGTHSNFEQQAGLDDSTWPCPQCGSPARRRPFSSVPHLKGETVSKSIPEPQYRNEAMKRDLSQSWGDATRSMELLRGARREDAEGNKYIDTPSIS